MPSDRQKTQLAQSQVRRILDTSQPTQGEYSGRESETGLSIIRTANGSVLPAYLEGSAQPFIGENILFALTGSLAYGITRDSADIGVTPVDVIEELGLKVAIVFTKTGGPKRFFANFSANGTTGSTTTTTTINGIQPADGIGSGWFDLPDSDTTESVVTITTTIDEPNPGSPSAGTISFDATINIDPGITNGDITISQTLDGSWANAIDTGVGAPGSSKDSGFIDPALTDFPGFETDSDWAGSSTLDTANHVYSEGLFIADQPCNYRSVISIVGGGTTVTSALANDPSFTWTVTLTDRIPYMIPEVWVGGDRPNSVLLGTFSTEDAPDNEPYLLDLVYGASEGVNIFVFTRDSEGSPVTYPLASYHVLSQSDVVTTANYSNPSIIVTDPNDWKSSLATFTVPEPLSGDACIDANRDNAFANIQDGTKYTIDINQDIMGTPLAERLLNGESITDAEVIAVTVTSDVGCTEGSPITLMVDIDAIIPTPVPDECINIVGAVVYDRT